MKKVHMLDKRFSAGELTYMFRLCLLLFFLMIILLNLELGTVEAALPSRLPQSVKTCLAL
jgi:hypothetical protein